MGANIVLARVAKRRFDAAGERAAAETALAAAASPVDQMQALFYAADGSMFEPGDAALRYADRLLALAESQPGVKPADTAEWRTLRARALLNHGDTAGAYAELKRVLASRGGLKGGKVNLIDAVMRSDLAIAALLTGNAEDARKYLAYTGAGRLDAAPFASAVSMQPPACGDLTGLRPDDVAVVEFSIASDGSVPTAQPIYASRTGPYANLFAEAVAGWSWRAEDAAKIPLFYRAASRVELRCTTAEPRPAVITRLGKIAAEWLEEHDVSAAAVPDSDAVAVTALRQDLQTRQKAGGGLALLPVLIQLAFNATIPADERTGLLRKAIGIADAAGAPIAVKVFFRCLANGLDEQLSAGVRRQRLRELLAQPEVAADPVTSDTLRVLIAEPGYRSAAPTDSGALLQQVAGDPRLTKDDALRVAALVRLSSLQARTGDLAGARQSYLASGLSAQQCSIVDAQPVLRRNNAGPNDFPLEAMRWGFEGWVRTEFDVTAAGRTANQRVTIAYPPFVFRDAGVGVARGLAYQQSYRPDAGLGCGGAFQNITFLLPK